MCLFKIDYVILNQTNKITFRQMNLNAHRIELQIGNSEFFVWSILSCLVKVRVTSVDSTIGYILRFLCGWLVVILNLCFFKFTSANAQQDLRVLIGNEFELIPVKQDAFALPLLLEFLFSFTFTFIV